MAHLTMLTENPLINKQDKEFKAQLETWVLQQGHELSEVSISTFTQEQLKTDVFILAIPVEQNAYQAFKRFLQTLPEQTFKDGQVFPFILGGTMAHVSVMELYLQPLLNRLGITESLTVVPKSTKSQKQRYVKQLFSQTRFNQFLQPYIAI
ncbi:hypothetical protein MKX54_09950 [Alkalihalobacillus sp. FSL R5-0424]